VTGAHLDERIARRPAVVSPGPHPGHDPGAWYTSPELLREERRALFDRSWALVGTVEQVAEVGAYVTATVGLSPLVVVRSPGGALRAFHNLCPHRGLALVEGSGTCGRYLTCPYHQWSFDTDGTLRRIPQSEEQFADVDVTGLGLHPASVDTWHGMVFANPDPHAPPLRQALGELGRRLEHFVDGPMVEVASVTYEVSCNWKLIVENHVDVYHLWFVHRRSLAAYDHRSFSWELLGDNWWSFEPQKDPAGLRDEALPWLDASEYLGIGASLLFPNLMIVTTNRYFATYDAVPVAPDRTRLTLRVRSTEDRDGHGLVGAVRSFLAEDITVCERLQTSVASPRFGLGPLAATHELPIVRFHQAVARACHG